MNKKTLVLVSLLLTSCILFSACVGKKDSSSGLSGVNDAPKSYQESINVGSNEAYLDAQIAIIAFVQDAEGNLAFEQNTEDTGLDLVNGYKVVSYNKEYELSLEGEQEEVVQ